jgi:Lhr-like helicase
MLFNKVFDFLIKSINHNKNTIRNSDKYLNLNFDSIKNQLKYRSKSFNDSKRIYLISQLKYFLFLIT